MQIVDRLRQSGRRDLGCDCVQGLRLTSWFRSVALSLQLWQVLLAVLHRAFRDRLRLSLHGQRPHLRIEVSCSRLGARNTHEHLRLVVVYCILAHLVHLGSSGVDSMLLHKQLLVGYRFV